MILSNFIGSPDHPRTQSIPNADADYPQILLDNDFIAIFSYILFLNTKLTPPPPPPPTEPVDLSTTANAPNSGNNKHRDKERVCSESQHKNKNILILLLSPDGSSCLADDQHARDMRKRIIGGF